jgi:thiol-disulfide isomerase/thioredoxin
METDAESRSGFVQRWKSLARGRALRIVIGLALAVALIAVVSVLTGGKVTNDTGRPELVGHHLKGFTLAGLNSGEVKAPWESGHPSVIVFFASFCIPCQGEMPKVAAYIRTHSSGDVKVLAIDADDERSAAQKMIKKDGVTFPVAFDPDGVVTSGTFGFEEVPESVFVNAHGVVTGVHNGAIPARDLAAAISSLTPRHTT